MAKEMMIRESLGALAARSDVSDQPHRFLVRVKLEDIDAMKQLGAESVPRPALDWLLGTLEFHEKCLRANIDDGRTFYKAVAPNGLIGFCGIHQYVWGPPKICWASWFVLAPRWRRTRAGYAMAKNFLALAAESGFSRMYVETYSSDPRYSRIADLLPRFGFRLESRIPDYVQQGVDSLIYSLDLCSQDRSCEPH